MPKDQERKKSAGAVGKKRPRAEQSKTKIKSSSNSSNNKKKTGLDEIDDLFAAKKTADQQQKVQDAKDEKERKRRRQMRREEEAERALVASGAAAVGGSTAAAAPDHLRSKAKSVKGALSYTRDDAAGLQSGEWANDGLGGIFDGEGYTGRKADGGMKIYKAHLFNKKGFGTTKDCPFDCDCCFI